jgi:2-aminoadipate transaminase
MSTSWNLRYAKHAQTAQSSTIRELLKLTQAPDVISFGGGLPAPELFPIEEMRAASDRVLSQRGSEALQYSITEGYLPLREMITRQSQGDGLKLTPENILITTGSQQSLDLVGKLLLDDGDRVVVENPTFLGALQSFGMFGAQYEPVPMDDDGVLTDRLPSILQAGPKFMYIMPTFQNPCGVTLSRARRRALVELADTQDVPILEDDPYHSLRFKGDHLPSLQALDAERQNSGNGYLQGNVIYLGSFSKTLAPGLRLAWISAAPEVIAKLVQIKQGADLHTSIFVQMLAYETARDGFLERHIQTIRAVYGERRDAMLAAMDASFPPGVEWTKPEGGLFLWVKLPEGLVSSVLLRAALKKNVAFVPGNSFFAGNSQMGDRYFRMNFSNRNPELIREGVQRLAQVLHEALRSSSDSKT